jgi:hypothetical protein
MGIAGFGVTAVWAIATVNAITRFPSYVTITFFIPISLYNLASSSLRYFTSHLHNRIPVTGMNRLIQRIARIPATLERSLLTLFDHMLAPLATKIAFIFHITLQAWF